MGLSDLYKKCIKSLIIYFIETAIMRTGEAVSPAVETVVFTGIQIAGECTDFSVNFHYFLWALPIHAVAV